jgi:hypothetical protein
MNARSFFSKLKRRRVYSVGGGLRRRSLVVHPGGDTGLSVFQHSELAIQLVVPRQIKFCE